MAVKTADCAESALNDVVRRGTVGVVSVRPLIAGWQPICDIEVFGMIGIWDMLLYIYIYTQVHLVRVSTEGMINIHTHY